MPKTIIRKKIPAKRETHYVGKYPVGAKVTTEDYGGVSYIKLKPQAGWKLSESMEKRNKRARETARTKGKKKR